MLACPYKQHLTATGRFSRLLECGMLMNVAGLDGLRAQVKGGAGRAGGGGSGDGVVRLKHLHASAAVEISAGEAERIRK